MTVTDQALASPRGLGPARTAPLYGVLFLVVAALVVARVAVNPLLLDLVVNYTADQGSILEKLHPTLYGFVACGLVALLAFPVALDAWEVRVARALLALDAGIVLVLAATAVAGRGGSAGFLIDTYATATCVALLFLFPPRWRRWVGEALVLWLLASALVAIAEFALKTRLQPFAETEYSFRPTGLASHPLELGLSMATAIGFAAATGWPRGVKLAAAAVFVLALAASGARTALVVGLAGALVIGLAAVGTGLSPRRRLERRLIAAVAALVAVPLLIGALYVVGALDRFGAGLADQNAQARLSIYGVFGHMSLGQILLGMDPAAMRRIAKTSLDLEFIESSVVIFVALFGLLGTALLCGLFARLVAALLDGARLSSRVAAAVFFVVALSSNGLSTKGASIFLLVALLVALRPEPGAAGAGPPP